MTLTNIICHLPSFLPLTMGYFKEIYHRRFIIKLLLFVYSAFTGLWLRAIKNWLDKSNGHMCHREIHMKTDWKLVARISPSTMLRCHSKLKQIFVNYISTYKVQTHWFVMEIFDFPKTSADWNSLITEKSIIDFIRERSEVQRRTTLSTWSWNRLQGTTDWTFHSVVLKTQLFAI